MSGRLIVIVDTTETFSDLRLTKLDWMQLLALCANDDLELFVPHAVLRETVRHWEKQVKRARGSIKSAAETLSRLGVSVAADRTDSIDVDGYEAYLAGRLHTAGATVLDPPEIELSDLIGRDLEGRKPFSESGRGMRDAINWASVVETAASCSGSDQVFWVSGNHKDFATGADGQLHGDLHADLSQVSAQVVWASGLRRLLDGEAFVELVAQLEPTPEALEQFLQLGRAPAGAVDGEMGDPQELVVNALLAAADDLPDSLLDLGGDESGGIMLGGAAVPDFEGASFGYVELDEASVAWQAYETFDDTTLMIRATATADVTVDGCVWKADAYHLPSHVYVSDWDWNDHYVMAEASFSAVLTFQLRLELGVGVDFIELESIDPVF